MIDAKQVIFDMIKEAAEKGQRCPTNNDFADRLGWMSPSGVGRFLKELINEGEIVIAIYSRNYRVIRIEKTGKHTQCPDRGKPYRIIDKIGDTRLKW